MLRSALFIKHSPMVGGPVDSEILLVLLVAVFSYGCDTSREKLLPRLIIVATTNFKLHFKHRQAIFNKNTATRICTIRPHGTSRDAKQAMQAASCRHRASFDPLLHDSARRTWRSGGGNGASCAGTCFIMLCICDMANSTFSKQSFLQTEASGSLRELLSQRRWNRAMILGSGIRKQKLEIET